MLNVASALIGAVIGMLLLLGLGCALWAGAIDSVWEMRVRMFSGFVGAAATTAAVVVALFKEEIVRPRLVLRGHKGKWVHAGQQSQHDDEKGVKWVRHDDHFGALEVFNNSRVAARDVRIHMISITERDGDVPIECMHADEIELKWSHCEQPEATTLSAGRFVKVRLFELRAAQVEKGAGKAIAGVLSYPPNISVERACAWNVSFQVSGSNFKAETITLLVEWDGRWGPQSNHFKLTASKV